MGSSPDELALIAHVVATGDPAAFGELVRRHESRIRALLRRMSAGDTARADDLAQETFLRAFRHLAQFRADSSFATWAMRIAVRLHLSELRRVRPVAAAEPDPVDPAAAITTDRLDVAEALARLRPEQRLVLVLAHAHGYTHPEIADLTGWPLGTVKTHALRGAAALRALLEPGRTSR